MEGTSDHLYIVNNYMEKKHLYWNRFKNYLRKKPACGFCDGKCDIQYFIQVRIEPDIIPVCRNCVKLINNDTNFDNHINSFLGTNKIDRVCNMILFSCAEIYLDKIYSSDKKDRVLSKLEIQMKYLPLSWDDRNGIEFVIEKKYDSFMRVIDENDFISYHVLEEIPV